MNHKVPTWVAYIVSIVAIFVGYIWGSFFPLAPYTVFAGAVVSISTAYMVKRASDKRIDNECAKGVE
jgi:hypothetical protein